MALWSTGDQIRWVLRQLRIARETGDIDTELEAQLGLDELIDQHPTHWKDDPDARPT